jgi:VWFA-related protein
MRCPVDLQLLVLRTISLLRSLFAKPSKAFCFGLQIIFPKDRRSLPQIYSSNYAAALPLPFMNRSTFPQIRYTLPVRNRRLLCTSLIFLFTLGVITLPPTSHLHAEDAPKIHVDVKTVTLAATVRDKHGQIISNLTKDDFVLTDDSHPQTINYFAHDTNLPLTLGLLIDTSMSQRSVLSDERTASQHFLDQLLTNEKDKAFLVQFDHEVDLLEDLTPSKDKLHSALDQLGAPQFGSQSNSGDDSSQDTGRHHGGGTTLYDAIYLASNEVLSKQDGRKAVIVLTDGVDRGSKETLNGAIEAAQRANTVIYAIYFKGDEQSGSGNSNSPMHRGGMGGGWPGGGGGWPGGGGGRRGGQTPQQSHVDGKKILEQICDQTGGHMFEAKKEKVDQVYSTIAEELRSQYVLGYTPDKSTSDPGYHKLSLTAKKKDLFVQTRQGYYAGQ